VEAGGEGAAPVARVFVAGYADDLVGGGSVVPDLEAELAGEGAEGVECGRGSGYGSGCGGDGHCGCGYWCWC
jgi:hypothetical protein